MTVAVDTVGIVAGADEHGASSVLKSKQFPFWCPGTVVEVEVQGLGTAGWSRYSCPLPLTSLPGLGTRASVQARPQWGSPLAGLGSLLRMGVKTTGPVSRKCNPHLL